MAIRGFDHINIDTAKPEETVAFYEAVLGLENRPQDRPDFNFPGAWLFLGSAALVHLNFIDEDDRFEQRSGFNHIAFEGSDFDAMCALLDDKGLEYRVSDRPEISLKQIFFNDPNGIRIEVNIRG